MIDLHCHMLPGIDDGAPDLHTALEMAEIAVADGITMTACTPHICPGLYDNTGAQIMQQVQAFRTRIREADIPLEITYGADIQLVPEMVHGPVPDVCRRFTVPGIFCSSHLTIRFPSAFHS